MRNRYAPPVFVLCLAVLQATSIPAAEPAATVDRADQLRAGYLLNFVKFVEWPAGDSGENRTFCFVGGAGVREAIADARGHQHTAGAINIKTLVKGDSAAGCQLLYLDAATSAGDLDMAGLPVLTVSDAPDFIHHGGMVELFAEGNRLRFNINLDVARRAGLRISSSLLQLASHVEETGR